MLPLLEAGRSMSASPLPLALSPGVWVHTRTRRVGSLEHGREGAPCRLDEGVGREGVRGWDPGAEDHGLRGRKEGRMRCYQVLVLCHSRLPWEPAR